MQKLPLQKKLLSAFSILFVAMVIFAGTLFSDITELKSSSRWLNHTHNVISKAHKLIKLMVDQETGLRGYLIVGKSKFLAPFYSGKSQFEREINELMQNVSDNPSQVFLLKEIEKLAQEWHVKAAQPEILERQKVELGGKDIHFLQELLSKGTGKSILDRQRVAVERLQKNIKSSPSLKDSGNQHTAELLALSLIKHMVDQETGQRGFLITGKESFLEPLTKGRTIFYRDLNSLQRFKGMDNKLLDIVSEVKGLADEWHQKAASPEIAARRDIDRNQTSLRKVTAIVESEVGKNLMDKIRAKIDQFVQQEQLLIAERKQYNDAQHTKTLTLSVVGGTLIAIIGLMIVLLVNRTSQPLIKLISTMQEISESSDFTRRVDAKGMYEVNRIGGVFNRMALNTEQQAWLKSSALELSSVLQQAHDPVQLAERLTSKLGALLSCGFGAFYLHNETNGQYELIGSYQFKERKHAITSYAPGEGLIGQCALERKSLMLNGVPEEYTLIHSGLGEASPDMVMAIPIILSDQALAVLELATFGRFSPIQQALVEEQVSNIALGLRSLLNSIRTQELLEETQTQAEELQVREEELNDNNTLLERQAIELKENQKELKQSNASLQTQQEELRVANEELEEKAQDLNASQAQLEERNSALNETKEELEKHAEKLVTSSQYKSEFLANMSHELRTPLNSLLILSQLLMDNKEGNLADKQIDYASTIHDSGEDLLNLINDILDLSKIESGRLEIFEEVIHLPDFIAGIKNKFAPMAEKKGIQLIIESEHAPQHWHSDNQKLNQVIKNLLSNAIKFTNQGSVTVSIGLVPKDVIPTASTNNGEEFMAISVTDTGIGIPKDKQQIIFEAFQQADGTTSRNYGGTGLGLSISLELMRLLRGEIHLKSEEGKGSSFILLLPQKSNTEQKTLPSLNSLISKNTEQRSEKDSSSDSTLGSPQPPSEISITKSKEQINDDRHTLKPGDKSLLIIEDDSRFAVIVADVARERGFGVLVAENAHTGLHFADLYHPSAIVLDIGLPDMSGWKVMEQLKNKSSTRHIPVHIMSANDRTMDAMKGGAIGFYTKPVSMDDLEKAFSRIENIYSRSVKSLLLVEDDKNQLKSMQELLCGNDVEITTATSGLEAQQLIESNKFDCIVLDIGLPDMSGLKLLESLRAIPEADQIPVVVHSGRELESKERADLEHYAQSVIIKSAKSPERLLDDTTLFLHRVEDNLPQEQRQTIRMLHDSEALFVGSKVLLVDDDMRNIFSLSAVLQEKNVEVFTAANGKEALEQLEAEPNIALVLMDIMMPVMDGYEAMRQIRYQKRFKSLPIIALTAKAMKGDRAQCIEAGASDYLAKPVDTEKLLSMMRVWLYQ